jgi:hypothetical protein
MTGRHVSVVDGAEGVVWVEGIRARALTLADQLEQMRGWLLESEPFERDCRALMLEAATLLREVAGG